MIRKSGVVLFVFLVAIVLGFVYLLSGPILRVTMVYTLEKAFGAEVNIESVAIGLAPASLSIADLAITDRNEPKHNVLSFQSAHADLEVWPALMGYYVIDQLSVKGLAFGSERARTGEVYDRQNPTAEDQGDLRTTLKDKFNIELPTAESVMERLDIKTVDRGRELQKQIEQQKTVLADLESRLPDRSKLQEIEQKIKALTDSEIKDSSDLATKSEQLKAAKSQLKDERNKLQSIQSQISESRMKVTDAVTALRKAKDADLEKVQKMTDFKDGGLVSVSQILVGDVWAKRIAQLESFYRLAEPYIPEASERINKPEKTVKSLPNRILPIPNKPYPDFWVKQAVLHWFVAGGEAEVGLQNVTFEHSIIDRVTQFTVSAQTLPNLDSLLVEGQLEVDNALSAAADWRVSGVKIANAGTLDKMGLKLEQGVLDSSGSIRISNRQLDQQATLTLNQPSFTATEGSYSQKVMAVLNKQNSIPVKISAAGDISSPDISVSSPLDRLLVDAMLGDAKQKVAALKVELNNRINDVFESQLNGRDELLATIDKREEQVARLDQLIEDGLKSELGGLEDQAKDKIKDKFLKLGK